MMDNVTSPGPPASVPRGHCLLAGCSHIPEVECVVKGTEKQETLSVLFFHLHHVEWKLLIWGWKRINRSQIKHLGYRKMRFEQSLHFRSKYSCTAGAVV